MQTNSAKLQSVDSAPVLVVDDDPIFRAGLADFLRRQGFDILEAADSLTAFELAAHRKLTAIIVDIVLPERPFARTYQDRNQGIELARRLKNLDPTLAIIILSAFGDRSDAVLELATNGTRGIAYLTKGAKSSTHVLLQAIEETRAGHILIRTDELSRSVASEQRFWAALSAQEAPYIRRSVELFPKLTPREQEVAFSLAHAQTVEGAAEMLNIAEGTAEKHINRIYSKLELDRADHEDPPLRKSILLVKVCWLIDMLDGRDKS